jgi:hypothetical protein
MSNSSGWLPGPRPEILAMCQNWLFYYENAKGEAGDKWGPVVPATIP